MRKGYQSVMNAYKKGKGLHLEAEPTRIKLYWVPSSRDMALDKKPPSITTKGNLPIPTWTGNVDGIRWGCPSYIKKCLLSVDIYYVTSSWEIKKKAFNINISSPRTDLRLLKARLETRQWRVPMEAYVDVAREKHARGKGACVERSWHRLMCYCLGIGEAEK